MRKTIALALVASCLLASCAKPVQTANYEIIPMPQEITVKTGEPFQLSSSTAIIYPDGNIPLRKNAELLSEYITKLTGFKPAVLTETPKSNAIILTDNLDSDNPEAYSFSVTPDFITIDGASAAGNFYGCQTLRKAIPQKRDGNVEFPCVNITDQPRFAYRGAHFDVSRHFFPVDSVKSFIDMLALHNINRLHWHITDDQGWRIEIKSRPELTAKGSIRPGTMIDKDFESSDSIPYGGFYTQDEARDIVKYAADRHITVIPEIDLPGHMLGALKAYPELGCTGGPYEVWTKWGVAEDVLCAGNDSTIKLIDDVLSEITAIFPSEYIHVGGDECPKVRWEKCPKCQAKIKQLGLKSDSHSTAEQKLQTYVMTEASNILARHGRKMIGWDEILEGGLTPGAVVMSWRGTEGAVEAAKQNHYAIMTPTNYCYFDYYQTHDRANEPLAGGGVVTLEQIYGFDPVPASLAPEQRKYIMGVQANMWTEYMPTLAIVQYQALPRMAALSEVQWCAPDKKDYVDFTRRLQQMLAMYESEGYNYAKHVYDITPHLDNNPGKGAITATLSTMGTEAKIYYTLDGTEPTEKSNLYTNPVDLTESCTIKAVAIRPSGRSHIWTDSVAFNKATSRTVTLGHQPHSRYAANGGATLADGRFGTATFTTGEWVGWEGVPIIATVDLGKEQSISKAGIRLLIDTPNWIFDTRGISVEVSSDGNEWNKVAGEDFPVMTAHDQYLKLHSYTFNPVKARYVRITAQCETSLPAWHGVGEGKPGFIFADEIIID